MMDNAVASLSPPDFRVLFESAPGLYLVLLPNAPEFTIVAASDAYLRATLTERAAILGRGLFDVFPDNPDDPDATGVSNLRASLNSVLQQHAPHTMAVQKYDIQRPESAGGGFEERHWSPVNSPVLGAAGEVIYILHRVEDVTELIRFEQQRREDSKRTEELHAQAERHIEEALVLRASEALYRTLGEAVPDFIWACKANGEAIYVNRRWTEYTGLTIETAGDLPPDVIHHPEDYPALVKCWRAAAANGESYETEFRYRRKDGIYRWFMARAVPVKDEQERVIQWIGTSTDIHERKMGEQALRESEENTRLIVETALDAVVTIDAAGIITGWNAQAEAIFGWSRQEALGRFLAETIIPLSHREAHQRGLQHFLATGEGPVLNKRIEITALHRSGYEFPVELAITAIRVKDTFTFSAFVRDITERKQTEEKLRESDEQFRATFEQAAVGIAHVSLEGGRLLRINRKFCEMLGYSHDELLAHTFQDITHPDDLTTDFPFLRQMLTGELLTYSMEKRYFHKNASLVWINLTVSLVRDAQGLPKYFISVVEDITQSKRLEAQLLQAQKLESVGRLAGGVAHDFNNLLTAILGYGELLQEEFPLSSQPQKYLHNILQAADKASHLTKQLLAFARRQVIEPKVVNLNDLLLSLDTMLRRLIGEHIELVMLPHEGLYSVRVDPGQFDQILVNLVINARDALPHGGKITLETSNVTLDEDYCLHHDGVTPGEYAVLAVSDTGTGMEEAVRLHIFEPFFTTKEKGRGTGLGLATVYGIVKQAGGHIWLYSEPGEGTTFKIYLPRTTAPTEEVVATVVTAPLGGSETILVVEDEPAVRMLATQTLRARGYTVWEATNGEEALRLVLGREQEIALLLTDVVMPQMSGKELADVLQGLHPGLEVLYASGYTENTIVHHGVLEEGVTFLSKPFTPTMLARKVREILDKHQNIQR